MATYSSVQGRIKPTSTCGSGAVCASCRWPANRSDGSASERAVRSRVVIGSGAVSSIALVIIDAHSEAWTVKVDGEVTITGTSVVSEDGLTLTTTTHGRTGRSESVSVYDKQ